MKSTTTPQPATNVQTMQPATGTSPLSTLQNGLQSAQNATYTQKPYDPNAPVPLSVQQSGTVNSGGPQTTPGWTAPTTGGIGSTPIRSGGLSGPPGSPNLTYLPGTNEQSQPTQDQLARLATATPQQLANLRNATPQQLANLQRLRPPTPTGAPTGSNGSNFPAAPPTPMLPNGVPDYNQIANYQAQLGTALSRFNQVTPFGTSTWTRNGNDWTQTNSLTPEQQQVLNRQNFFSNASMDALNRNFGNVDLSGVDQSKLTQAPTNAGMTTQNAIMQRLQPQLERQRDQLRTSLINQGIREGTQAWDQSMTDQNQRENDLLSQAALQGVNADQSARASELQNQIALGNQPIQLMNALRGGVQLNVPQFSNTGSSQTPDFMNAAQSTWNANQNIKGAKTAQQNNMTNGLFGLGSAFLSTNPFGW